ncbi:MAG: peptidase M14 [Gracilimonas sp.]|uniref:M14 family metallopeptidase n=1 Tax=Gracilimonas sp. TaxID=1974203 RepID=UPI0019B6B482|nr:M14 family metallopeptidase [Gracilimonas sp.]MBD3617767.1 peptidase M14 [Gracilimonas sp.]
MKNIIYTTLFTFLVTGLLLNQSAEAQTSVDGFFPAAGSPVNPEVQASWNRYYNYQGISDLTKELADAHPNLIKRESIGKSYEGRDIWLLTVTNFAQGNPNRKPAMYIDGNIHSNEIQGTEVSMYTAWYLAEMFGDNEFITQLMNEKTFYIVPTINPDGRENFFDAPNTASSPRSGIKPIDNDLDGEMNEDGYDDLNGDGSITMMRRKNPRGQFVEHPDYPEFMQRTEADEFGEYEMLGYEGLDNDGDGRINEDGEGYYDPNRDWGWKWQPDYIQGGAHKYPFSLPENRAVMEFVMNHPNIAAAQSYHNSGGMILRGPGAEEDRDTYNRQDIRVYNALGEMGERLIPGYNYWVVYDDLYTVFGGELDWFYGSRGAFTFTNELWASFEMFNEESRGRFSPDTYEFNKNLLFNDALVEWEPYNHPQYGEIEIGGTKKNFGRAHPGFLLEQMAHRNMAFTIYHAYHTPNLVIDEIAEKDLGGGLKEVTAVVTNTRMIPTHASQDLKYKITRPNYISIDGANVEAGMIVTNRDLNQTVEQKNNPQKISVDNIPGMESVTVRWIISRGNGYTVTVDSEKGGVVSKSK